MVNQDLIQKFLNKRLDSHELEAFEKQLQQDSVLREDMQLYSNLYVVLQSEKRNLIKKRLENFEEQQGERNPNKFWIILCFVALIGVLSTVVFWEKSIDSEALFNTYFEAYPNTLQPTEKGDVSKETLPFREYELKNYSAAAEGFLTLLEQEVQPDIQFYYTMSILNSGTNNDEALLQLSSLEERNTKYLPQVLWYSGLLELKRDSMTAAESQFQKLIAHPAKYKNREAKELLKKLD